MSDLSALLRRIPDVYADLLEASTPGRRGEPSESPDPRAKPAPGNLSVMDHRHLLVRGLRWWVDAVGNDSRARVGQSVPGMCALLLARVDVMDTDDAAELRQQLAEWVHDAYPFMGRPDAEPVRLPLEALGAEVAPVRVKDAAALLGCTVRTIRRRVPAERRQGGLVLLRDAWRCELCDLPHGECAHTAQSLTAGVAQ